MGLINYLSYLPNIKYVNVIRSNRVTGSREQSHRALGTLQYYAGQRAAEASTADSSVRPHTDAH